MADLSLKDFYRLVLPDEGAKLLVLISPEGKPRALPAGYDTDDLATATLQAVEDYPNDNIYYATAAFKNHSSRKRDNALAVKHLRLDIDVGPDKDYPSKDEAKAALRQFLVTTKFPAPNIVVYSGRGLHVYWVMQDYLYAADWLPLAKQFKALVGQSGLAADPTVTADLARVLRPPETIWRKPGAKPRTVRVAFYDGTEGYPVATLKRALTSRESALADVPSAPFTAPEQHIGNNANLALPEGQYPKADANLIADQCGQMARFRAGEQVSYANWQHLAGIFMHCTKGQDLYHEWSQHDDRYDEAETQTRLDTWSGGATLCQTFRDEDEAGSPCKTCSLRCKSPWQLGLPKPKTEFTNDEGEVETFTPRAFPEGAWVEKGTGRLQIMTRVNIGTRHQPDWKDVPVVAANLPFYLESIAQRSDGTFESDVVVFRRPGERSSFVLEHAVVADPRTLARALFARGITGEGRYMAEYVVSYLEALKKQVADTQTHRQMGWIAKDKFLIGDTVITPKGKQIVRTDAALTHKAKLFDNAKAKAEWTNAVNALYGCRNGQPYQFVICAAFASTLVPLLDAEEFNGIPIGVTSDESGYGKSTVTKIALAAFGKVERNLNVLTGDEVSVGAVEVQCSTFNNMPCLFDEMTNKGAQDTSHILYMLSNGVARARLRQDGTPRPANPPWRGISFITGNRNIFQKLTESKVNPEAAQMRLWEIPLENYPRLESLARAADFVELTNSVRSGYGSVGVTFLRAVMSNYEATQRMLWKEVKSISAAHGVRHDKERFYVYTLACVVVAARILQALKLVAFKPEKIRQWGLNHMDTLREVVSEYRQTTLDDFANMLGTFVGEGRVISTRIEGGLTNQATSEFHLRAVPVLRIIREGGHVYMTAHGFHQYCLSVSKSPHKFRKELADAGCFHEDSVIVDGMGEKIVNVYNYALGQGVAGMPLGMTKCYRLNFERVVGGLSQTLDTRKQA